MSFLRIIFALFFYPGIIFSTLLAQTNSQPNVVIIITDDQGYGDLGWTGNPHIKTPVLDQLASESIRFNNFYVSPVCAPTRSSLMTGRYSLRTGMRDTYNGGAIMSSEEITMAEMLKEVNYKTGAFGKWHLGDNYPFRPGDQGFDESVIHLSGGMGQVGDFTTWFQGDSSYFDPVLWHNGNQEAYEGYCSDIFTDQALAFIEENHESPFLCYLAFNAPHTPLQVPDEYYEMYKDIDPSAGFSDDRPFPEMNEKDMEDARKVYAMVSNIDDNIGRLLAKLDDLEISEETMVVFMTDNGPQQRRYVGGMRGRKGSVYRGGVRVPFFVRYPALLEGNRDVETMTAHLDVLPTLADLCKAKLPTDRTIDGKSLVPLLKGEAVDWDDRSLFFYWTRRYPERYHNIALHKDGFKLVGNVRYDSPMQDFELFNIEEDPYELNNLIEQKSNTAGHLKFELDKIYNELTLSPHMTDPPRIMVGSEKENPVYLNRNDAGGQRGIWAQESIYGNWRVHVKKGTYDVSFKFVQPVTGGGQMILETGTSVIRIKAPEGELDIIEMKNLPLPEMDCDLTPFYLVEEERIFPFWVQMDKVE